MKQAYNANIDAIQNLQDWDYPGARWWKFDFHTHTPASLDTEAWQRAKGSPEEITPYVWLMKYMTAGVDCVAITDHNSGAWVDQLKTAYSAMKEDPPAGFRPLYLFPGVELSVNGGFHLLAIFDPSATTSEIDRLLGKVEYAGSSGDSDGVSRASAEMTIHAVLDAGAIPIPAHADGMKGLLQLKAGSTTQPALDTQTLSQLLSISGVLAMEIVDRTRPKPNVYKQRKVNWTEVLGSDCHSFQGAAVPGSRFTWIKMATPSIDGLRLALLDGQTVSVRRSDDAEGFSPYSKPTHFIESIEISNARAMGRGSKPALFRFSPYFNAIVGGRGTGKSTCIHAMRLTYRREGELALESEAGQTFVRFNKVGKGRHEQGGLKTETSLTITLNRDGIRHRLLWCQEGQGHLVEEWDEATLGWKPSLSQVIGKNRFPIRLFSQGQIAALAGDSQQALLQVIDEAAGTSQALTALNEAKQAFFSTRAKQRELEGKLKGRDLLNLSLQDVRRKLARFEAIHHAEVLRNYQNRSKQGTEISRQFENVAELANSLRNTAEDLTEIDFAKSKFDSNEDYEVLELIDLLNEAIALARKSIEATAKTLSDAGSSLKHKLSQTEWNSQAESSKTAYETLKADLQSQGVNDPTEYGRFVQEQQHLEAELTRLDSLQKQFEELAIQAKAQIGQVWEARREVSRVRSTFLERTLADNLFVRIRLIPYGRDSQAIERSVRELIGTTEKFRDDIYAETSETSPKGLVADLLFAANLVEKPGEPNTESFEQSIKDLQGKIVQACRGTAIFGAWFNKYLAGEAEKRPELIDQILCWFSDDGLQVQYSQKGNGKEFQSIGQASAGQRAAAMLSFLLADGNEPLVLDQPEDDLDNHLIYDLVVQQIRANKQRRQLVIVTHNPNIVVNGDAEMIHALDFKHQCFVNLSGSLQDKNMREEICKVMEGGKDAFERRYQRLGRDLSSDK